MSIEKVIKKEKISSTFKDKKRDYLRIIKHISSQSQLTNSRILSDFTDNMVKKFIGTYHSIEEEVNKEELFSNNNNRVILTRAYCAYITSESIIQELPSNGNNIMSNTEDLELIKSDLITKKNSDYSLIHNLFDNYVNYLMNSSEPLNHSTKEFFQEYQKQALNLIHELADKQTLEKIHTINWDISEKQVDTNIDRNYNSVEDNKNLIEGITKKGDSDPESKLKVPLQRLVIPENEVLSKKEIIGDRSIIEELEYAVDCLLFYDFVKKMNPLKDKNVHSNFLNRFLLQGGAGTGKSSVAKYIVNYAENICKEEGIDLMVTKLDQKSHWKSGDYIKLKYQLSQLSEDNRLYLVFQDEIDQMLGVKAGNEDNLPMVQEFDQFCEGHYQNRGNYLIIGTINDLTNLRSTTSSRFQKYNWEGARTEEDIGRLIKLKLGQGLRSGFIKIGDKDIKKLSNLAYNNELNGRDITYACNQISKRSFKRERIREIRTSSVSYEDKISALNNNFRVIKFREVEEIFSQYITEIKNTLYSSEEFKLK